MKTFIGNEATKKTKKNLLKQQYGNFKAEGSKTLEKTFTRLQVIIGQLQFMDVEIKQDDLNQKFLTSLASEWLMHTIVWRNRSDLDTMSLNDLYNHLKVYELEVQKKSEPNPQNMAFISSAKHSSGNEDGNTVYVPTASTNVPTASASVATISQDTTCTYIASQSSGSQIKFEDINQIDEDDIEEMDIKWNMALLSMRADKSDKNKEGLGYTAVPPPHAQLYLSLKKDLSWTGLLECADDTVTDYSRPSPTVESTLKNDQNKNPSVFENVASPITPKPFIKFVKPKDSQSKSKTDKKETPKKPPVKYAEQYRKPNKKPNKKGEKEFHTQTYCSQTLQTFIKTSENKYDDARPNRTFFNKQAHSYVNRHVHRTSAVRSPYRAPWVPTINRNYPPVNRKFSTGSRNFPTANRKFPTASRKFPTGSTKSSTIDMGMKGKAGSSQNKIDDKGYWDSGCSRHMTSNISYLSNYEPFDGGYVSFGQGECKITGKGTIKTGKLDFENVYFVKDLKYNLFSVSQICDNKNSVLFIDSECIMLGKDFKLLDDANILLRTPRQHNMYSIDLNNIVRLGHLNFKTMNELVRHNLVRGLPTKCFENDHTYTACLKGKQHKASCKSKLVNCVTKPLHTLHMDLFGPTYVSSISHKWYCLVVTDDFSRVLVNKSHNKTPYELFNGRLPAIGFFKPFGYHVMILNTLDNLGTFEEKGDEVDAGTISTNLSGIKDAASKPQDHCSTEVPEDSGNPNPITSKSNPPADQMETLTVETPIPTVSSPVLTAYSIDSQEPSNILGGTTNSDESNGEEADISNMETAITASPTPTLRIHKDHPKIYQMDMKSAFLYGTIDEEVYVMQPPRFQDPEFPARVYKVEKAMHQVTPKECHLHAVKRIFRYLKGHPKLGLWYPKESPFDLVAYSESDYGGATQDRKSTTGGCQFLGRRLISWQCKKQTIVATSTTEVEYVAAASFCGQVLDCFEKKLINVDHIHTDENVADLLTKPFDAGRFQYLVGTKILATVDGIVRTVSESSLRRNLKLRDEEGISSLPDVKLFENLTLIGYNISPNQKFTFQKGQFSHQWKYLIHTIMQCISPKSTRFNEFSSNIATTLVCLATNRTYNFSKMIFDGLVRNVNNKISKFLMYPRFLTMCLRMSQFAQITHTHTYVVPFHTRKLFTTLRVNSPSFSGRIVPLFDIMLVQQGEGSGTPTEPHHTPSPEAPSPSHTTHTSPSLPLVTTTSILTVTPTETTPIRQYTRRARIAQSSALPTVVNKPASPQRDVSQWEACPTGSGFIVDQDRATIAKSSTLPYDSAPRVTSPAAVEGSMQQTIPKLTALCTSLQRQLSELTDKFQAQEVEINRLKERVKLLEEREGLAAKSSRDGVPIKGRSIDDREAATERISDDSEEMATVLTLMDAETVLASGVIDVPTGSGSIPTASTPAEGLVPTGSEEVPTASLVFATATVVTPVTRRKGKEVMVESKTPKKQKVQKQIDAQVARELEEQLEREDHKRAEQIARDAEVARIHVEEEL
nr:hypothetical protein [Tanacetum cinerariifolium]